MARRPRNRPPNAPEQPIPNDAETRRLLENTADGFFSRLFGGQRGGIVGEARDRGSSVNFRGEDGPVQDEPSSAADLSHARLSTMSDDELVDLVFRERGASTIIGVDYGDTEARIIAGYAQQSSYRAGEEMRQFAEDYNRLHGSWGSGRVTRTGRHTTNQLPEGGPAPWAEELLAYMQRVMEEGPQPSTAPNGSDIARALGAVIQRSVFDDSASISIDRDIRRRSIVVQMEIPEERFAQLNGNSFDQLLAEEIARQSPSDVYSEAEAIDTWPTPREPIEPDPNAEHRQVRGRRLRLRAYEKKDEDKG